MDAGGEAARQGRPDGVPEKFWDDGAGAVRVDALLRSYRELEKRLGRSLPLPQDAADEAGRARLLEALGRPKAPEDYAIEPAHPMLQSDPDINRRLHDAGFTQAQTQLVYELAAERLLPVLDDARGEMAAERERERLARHFGGDEAWRQTAKQLRTWGERSLSPEVYATLSASHDGVLALHEMMRRAEPEIVGQAGSGGLEPSEDRLQEMMRDPRYWRDRDPQFIARVTDGFKRLYSG
ncbi:MAG: hypothetical protein KDG89_12625 [Geminicoccaceae bacterium]|nr:hypothetical protein [Geminicoccaceae bacterium]